MKKITPHITPSELSGSMLLTMSLSSLLEYNEYMMIMCNERDRVNLSLLHQRGLSLSLSVSHMKGYLQMKTNFKDWFLYNIGDSERQQFISFIQGNLDMLMNRSIDKLEYMNRERFMSVELLN